MRATTDYVFDTEPVIAFCYDEPGAGDVADRLRALQNGDATGAISHATATEIGSTVARPATGERDLRVLRATR